MRNRLNTAFMLKICSFLTVLLCFFLSVACSRFDFEPYLGKAEIRNRRFSFKKLNIETCNVSYNSTLYQNAKFQENLISTIDELEKVVPINFEKIEQGDVSIRFFNSFSGFSTQFTNSVELFNKLKIPKQYENFTSDWVIYRNEGDKFEIYFNIKTLDELSDFACKRIITQAILETVGFEIRNEETNSIFSNILNLSQKELFTSEDIEIINKKYPAKCNNVESPPNPSLSLESIGGQNGCYINLDLSNLGGNTVLQYGIVISSIRTPEYPSDEVSFTQEYLDKETNSIQIVLSNFNQNTPIINKTNAKRALLVSGLKPGVSYSIRSYAKNIYGVGYSSEVKLTLPIFSRTLKGEMKEIGDLKFSKNYVFQDGILLSNDYYYLSRDTQQNTKIEVSKINLNTRENTTLANTPSFTKSGNMTICKANKGLYAINLSTDNIIEVAQYDIDNSKWTMNVYNNSFVNDLPKFLKIDFIKNGDKLYLFASRINEMAIYEFDFVKNNFILLKSIFENSIFKAKPYIIENNVYFFYGVESKDGPLYHRNNMWKLNMQNWTLNKLANIPTNLATNGVEIAHINNKIYVLPKSSTNNSFWRNSQNQTDKNDFWEYDLETERWSLVNQIIDAPLYNKNTASFIYNSNMYLVKGTSLIYYIP